MAKTESSAEFVEVACGGGRLEVIGDANVGHRPFIMISSFHGV